MTYLFSIPGEPTGKARPRVYGKHAVTPEKTVLYENLVKMMAQESMAFGGRMLEGPLRIEVECLYSIPVSASKKKQREMAEGRIRPTKSPDADNCLKVVADALNGIMYKDDSQIVEALVTKNYDKSCRVIVTVGEIGVESE